MDGGDEIDDAAALRGHGALMVDEDTGGCAGSVAVEHGGAWCCQLKREIGELEGDREAENEKGVSVSGFFQAERRERRRLKGRSGLVPST